MDGETQLTEIGNTKMGEDCRTWIPKMVQINFKIQPGSKMKWFSIVLNGKKGIYIEVD